MKLKELRQNIGKSQKEVAEDLKISRATYARYEAQETEPNIETIIKLADYYKTTTDNLLEHSVPYLFDLSALSVSQQTLIKEIKKLSDENCQRISDYIMGLMVAEEEKQNIINFFNKRRGDDE